MARKIETTTPDSNAAKRRAAARRAIEYTLRMDPRQRTHDDWAEAAEEAEFWRLRHREATNHRYGEPQVPTHDCAEGLLAEIEESPHRSAELLLAVRCWIAVTRRPASKSVKKSIEAWLRRECPDLGVREIQRLASVVNWSRKRR